MPTLLLKLLALTLSALAERLARELDEDFGNLGDALAGPALCQEKTTFDEKTCLTKDLRCFVKKSGPNLNYKDCVSRCDSRDPDTAFDDRPDKFQNSCEKHGFCTWAPVDDEGNDRPIKCKEKAGCQESLTKDGLDATNFKRCLYELGFRAFKECEEADDIESCFEPDGGPVQCESQEAFEVANPIDCMLQGGSNRPIGQRTVKVTVKEKKEGKKVKKVIECQRFKDEDADRPFWTDCKTPEPFPKDSQPKGEAINDLKADLEQYTFVRYGNDAIKACRDFQKWKETLCKKNCKDHQKETMKVLVECLTQLNFEAFAKEGQLINSEECGTWPESWHRIDSFRPADCLAFGPGVIVQIKEDGNVYCTRMPETCVTRKWPMEKDGFERRINKNKAIVDLTGVYFARKVAPDPF